MSRMEPKGILEVVDGEKLKARLESERYTKFYWSDSDRVEERTNRGWVVSGDLESFYKAGYPEKMFQDIEAIAIDSYGWKPNDRT